MIRRRIPLLPAMLLLAACEVPTQPPAWEQSWVVPVQGVEVNVAELLPANVTLSADSTAFEVVVDALDQPTSLGEMCPSCVPLDGLVAPKPLFQDTIVFASPLPGELISGTVSGGELDMVLDHNLHFDPLRPSSAEGAERGFMVVTITSAGDTLAIDTIHGDDVPFDSTVTREPTLPFTSGTVATQIDIGVEAFSPEGDPVEIDISDSLNVRIRPSTVQLSSATVAATAIVLDAPGTTLNFAGVDSALVERIQGGGLLLFDITNPFDLGGTVTLRFDTGAQTISKPVELQPGTYETTVPFEAFELQDLLNAEEVQVSTAGSLSSTSGEITFAPDEALIMDMEIELVVLIGGSEEGT